MKGINWLWPFVLLIGAGLLMAIAAGAVPTQALDLIGRAWPVLLILLGLHVLLGRRIRFANLLILLISIALTAGLIVTAYARQNAIVRADYKQAIRQAIPPEMQSIKVSVTLLQAETTISTADGRTVTGEFVGSTESQFESSFAITEGVGTLTLIETRPNALPQLDKIGRGTLTLNLPGDVTLDELTIRNADGALTLNLAEAAIRTLNARTGRGAINATLPALPPQSALGGAVRTDSGDLTLIVPAGLTLKLTVENGRAVFDQANFLPLQGGIVQSAGVRDFQAVLSVAASGTITLK